MAVSAEYRKQTLDMLNMCAMITDRAMFGGVGLYCEGLFFALMDGDRLFFKVDDSTRPDFEAAGMPPWNHGDGYYQVPPDVLDNAEELEVWIDKAVHVAGAKRAKAPASRRRTGEGM